MSELSSLGLRIYGGPLAVGLSRTALVSVGAAPDKFRPAPPTIVDEPVSWMLVHAQDYTLYAQYTRDFQTSEDEPAQLLICLFVPAGERLAGNKSPLDLLASLHDNFAVIGAPEGKLPTEPLDNSPFRQLLSRYQLEARPLPLPVMSGAEPASLRAASHSQLDALMRHSRYASLLRIGRLEIGYRCPSTVALTDDVPDLDPEPAPVIPSEAKESEKTAPFVAPAPVPEPVEGTPKTEPAPEPEPAPVIPSAPPSVIPSAPSVIPSEAKESAKTDPFVAPAPQPAPQQAPQPTPQQAPPYRHYYQPRPMVSSTAPAFAKFVLILVSVLGLIGLIAVLSYINS